MCSATCGMTDQALSDGTMGGMSVPALLAVSHGTADASGQRAVASLVAAVAERLPDVMVRAAHVDVEQPDVPTALAAIDGPVVVVPLLLSAGYHVHVDLAEATADRADAVVAGALGPDERLADVLAARLRERADLAAAGVILVAAGSSDDRANADCRTVGEHLSTLLGVPVSVAFLSAATPRLEDAVATASPGTVVATYLLAPGFFADRAAARATPLAASAPLLGDPDAGIPVPAALVDIVIDRYRAAARAR